jgi:hypothetical protein
MNMYFSDNKQKIPYVRFEKTAPFLSGESEGTQWSWDDYIMGYMGAPYSLYDGQCTWRIDWNPTVTGAQNKPMTQKWAICPADKAHAWDDISNAPGANAWRGVRRSYAVPQHNMGQTASFNFNTIGVSDWPPNPSMSTAVGLVLRQNAANGAASLNGGFYGWRFGTSDDTASRLMKIRSQYSVNEAMVQDTQGTFIFTERISAASYLGNTGWAEINNEDAHWQTSSETSSQMGSTDGTTLHGKDTYDYLFIDGHAETLNRRATLGTTNTSTGKQSGAWTVNPRD